MKRVCLLVVCLSLVWILSGNRQPLPDKMRPHSRKPKIKHKIIPPRKNIFLVQKKKENPRVTLNRMVVEAAKDIVRFHSDDAQYIRYLTRYNESKEDLLYYLPLVKLWPNFLSNQLDLTPTQDIEILNEDGTQNNFLQYTLYRIDIRDYGWKTQTFENLVNVEPFFHEEKIVKREIVEDYYTKKGRKKKRTKLIEKVVIQRADYLDATVKLKNKGEEILAIDFLERHTHSDVPIVRFDWFFYQTVIQSRGSDENPRYYQFLGIKDRKDFEKLVGYDKDVADKFQTPLFEAVEHSGVAQQPRRIKIASKIGGYWFETFDNELATGFNNPLTVIDDQFKFLANEVFAHLSNGLWGMVANNANGTLQNSVPDFIGHDTTTSSNNGKIEVPLGCLRCHKQSGLQDIKNPYFRTLFKRPLVLSTSFFKQLKEFKQNYLTPYERRFEISRMLHNDSVYEVSEISGQQLSKLVGFYAQKYQDQPVDLAIMSREFGVSKTKLSSSLEEYLRNTGSIDPIFGQFFHKTKGVPRDQFNERFALGMFMTRGEIPVDFVKPKNGRFLKTRKK